MTEEKNTQTDDRVALFAKLREPFSADEIELLPRYTGKKVDLGGGRSGAPRDAYRKCNECGGYHAFPCVHLSYVGHAGITQRLLDVDPEWTWEPLALTGQGTPLMSDGGMWIKLTVLGITRIGFGDAQGKTGPNATKEIIGDAIRNAAMRFGVGTYLWSKSEAAKAMLLRGFEGDDDDANSASETPRSEEQPQKRSGLASEKQVSMIFALGRKLGWSEDETIATVRKSTGKNHPGDLEGGRDGEASRFIDALQQRVKAQEAHEAEPPAEDEAYGEEPYVEPPDDAEEYPF